MPNLFKFDPHTHTSETSPCGCIPGAEVVEEYHALGYNGIAITDHLHDDYILSLDCRNDWNACVDEYLRGYRNALNRGREIGLNVILGLEIRFESVNYSDYLIYGIDEAFLYNNPYVHRLTPWAFFDKFGGELLIIHAHPYRDGNEVVFAECVHGLELYNGNPRHYNYDEKGLALYRAHPEYYPFCGSDAHRYGDVGSMWMMFDGKITDSFSLHEHVKRREYTLHH